MKYNSNDSRLGENGQIERIYKDLAIRESKEKANRLQCTAFRFDNSIWDARKAKWMTQQQVADKTGISIRQYQKFENGERNLLTASFRITMGVCFALDIDPKSLKRSHTMFL